MPKSYISVPNDQIWHVFVLGRIYKGGGTASSPKMFSSAGMRDKDFDIRPNPPGEDLVHPNATKGLSFSGSMERLADLGINGYIYEIAMPEILPDGLVINYKAKDHPLINVSRVMTVGVAMEQFRMLSEKMKKTGMKITSGGKLVAL